MELQQSVVAQYVRAALVQPHARDLDAVVEHMELESRSFPAGSIITIQISSYNNGMQTLLAVCYVVRISIDH